jgi:phosphoribosylamine-glycine ligase
VVIEEFLTGPEVSVLAFTDGKVVRPMVSSMDHKRIGDNDTGLNTGGMGTIAPNPYYTEDIAKECMKTIFLPTIRAMKKEKRTFKGCLYFGLMLTPNGPKVIEYNCRFGDPETQVVLPLLKSDLLTVMMACTNGTLAKTPVRFAKKHACCVIKADGLALGKGVIIAATRQEAVAAVTDMMANAKFGKSGSTVVIEEFLTGPEVSVLAFTDGKVVRPMVSSMDHKRIGDGDVGLNTGGMGTIAPNPYYTDDIAKQCMKEIFLPTIRAMKKEGRPFQGCLYFGLMLTPAGPKVIEYNCRFGDPETQVVLPLLKSDLLTVMMACTNGTLSKTPVRFSKKSACCVIKASKGYPESYKKGYPLTMSDRAAKATYIAGAKLEEGKLVTSGGRVTGTVAVRSTLEEAISAAYRLAAGVKFRGAYSRSDIGQRALQAKK